MKSKFGIQLMISLFMLLAWKVEATHIVGGELYYKYLGNNDYEISFEYYIDCENGNPGAIDSDRRAWFGVFDGNTNQRIASLDRQITRENPERVSDVNYKCITTQPDACVDRYRYRFNLTLPPKAGGYIVTYQRCCRNNSITNLFNPGDQGSTYFVKIEDTNLRRNNSAVFKNLPPNFLCTNAPLVFDHSATDADGDSLVYELYTPYNSYFGNTGGTSARPQPSPSQFLAPPFVRTTWASGYSTSKQIDATTVNILNPRTGELNFTPTQAGQFVVGIAVKEYRNGVLIGTTRRDFQFNVSNCDFEVVSSFFAPTKSCDFSVTFNNNSKGNGALSYKWDFGETDDPSDQSTSTFPSYIYKNPGIYNIQLIAGNINCADTYQREVRIVSPIYPDLGPDDTLCTPFTRGIGSGLNSNSVIWSTGEIANSISVNNGGLYVATFQVEGCPYKDSIFILEDKDKPQLIDDSVICSNVPADFMISAGSQFVGYRWNTGEQTENKRITTAGRYIVNVETNLGCNFADTVNIINREPPEISINDTLICPETEGLFRIANPNLSYLWSTGELSQQITVSEPGTYSIIVSDGKCKNYDTATLDIVDVGSYGLPADTSFCAVVFKVLDPGSQFKTYKWNTGSNSPTITVTEPGIYSVILTSVEGCTVGDSIEIIRNPLPDVGLGPDTMVCQAINPILDAGSGVAYLWQDGSTERTVTAFETGIYHVEVMDNKGCFNSDTVEVTKNPDAYPSELYMPSAFTPNGDGLNELYPDNQFIDIGVFYNLKIFNRWGEKIVDMDSPESNWNGKYKNQIQEEGVYIYLVSWIGCDNKRREKKGNLTLLK